MDSSYMDIGYSLIVYMKKKEGQFGMENFLGLFECKSQILVNN